MIKDVKAEVAKWEVDLFVKQKSKLSVRDKKLDESTETRKL